MPRPSTPTLTESERRLLEVLWKKKRASVKEVTDEVSKKTPLAYTTVLTTLNILEKKGFVTHEQEGRAFIYSAAITRSEAVKHALEHLMKQFFNGSPRVLAQHLVSEHEVDVAELESLRRIVDNAPDGDKK